MSTDAAIDYDSINPDDSDDFRLGFADVSDEQGIEPIPAGMHHLRIVDVSKGRVKKEDSDYFDAPTIRVEFRVAAGEWEGRPIFENFVVDPRLEVSMKRLKALLRAIGYENVDDDGFSFNIMDWIDSEIDGKVGIKPAKDGYDRQNNVREFYPHTMSSDEMLS